MLLRFFAGLYGRVIAPRPLRVPADDEFFTQFARIPDAFTAVQGHVETRSGFR